MSQLEKQLLGQRKDEGSIPIELANSINNECEKYECKNPYINILLIYLNTSKANDFITKTVGLCLLRTFLLDPHSY